MGGSSVIDAPDGAEQRRAGGTRPNVLLVMCDTARADALEPYGAPAGSTPTFADLARSGTVLPRRVRHRQLDDAVARLALHRPVAEDDGHRPGRKPAERPQPARRHSAAHRAQRPRVSHRRGERQPVGQRGRGIRSRLRALPSIRGRPVIPGPEVRARARWLASAVRAEQTPA